MKKELPLIHNYCPPARPAENGKNPILILAHGYGADQDDLFSLAGEFPDVFHVVAVRAPYEPAVRRGGVVFAGVRGR